MKEHEIRDLLAKNINIIDENFTTVSVEHRIKLNDGRIGKIDILAKDQFGCYSIIEIKKSDNTAREAVHELYKYAHMMKAKYRLKPQQIRCVLASTHWRELAAPFGEYAHFSEYDSIGIKLNISSEGVTIEKIDPKFEFGGNDPLSNHFFFEFSESANRNIHVFHTCEKFKNLLGINTAIFSLDYKGNEKNIIHPYGYALIVFPGNADDLMSDAKSIGITIDSDNEEYWPYELRDKIINTMPEIPPGSGESNKHPTHSFHSTINEWSIIDKIYMGRMFDDGIYDEDTIIEMCSGLLGQNPYSFSAKTSPARPHHISHVRQRVNNFLANNNRWKSAVNYIFDEINNEKLISIYIFHFISLPIMMHDIYRTSDCKKIPFMQIITENEDGSQTEYFGTIVFTKNVTDKEFIKIVSDVFKSSWGLTILLWSPKMTQEQNINILSHYGLTFETFRSSPNGDEILTIDNDFPKWTSSQGAKFFPTFLNENFLKMMEIGEIVDKILFR